MQSDTVDKGYAWVIALSGTLLMFFQASFFSIFGVIFVELVEYFKETKATIAWVGGCQQLVFGLSGLCIGPFVGKYGARKVGILAPLLVIGGHFAVAFCTDLWMLFICYGFMTGVGLGCYNNIGTSTIYPWFNKKRSLALSMVMCGIPLGAFVWPPLVTWLMHLYAWKGALIVCSGLHIHAYIAILLLRLPVLKQPDVIVKSLNIEDEKPKNLDSEISFTKEIEREMLKIEHDIRIQSQQESEKQQRTVWSWCELFFDPAFILFFAAVFFGNSGHIVPYMYSTVRGVLLGHTDTDSALLSSIIGACGGVGRIAAGFTGNRIGFRRRSIGCAIALCINGMASMCSAISDSFWYLALYSSFWGFASGFFMVFLMSNMVDFFGLRYAPEITGFNLMCCGTVYFLTNILTGIMLDHFSHPSLAFVVFGGMQCVASVFMLSAAIIKLRERKALKMPHREILDVEWTVEAGEALA